jgi:hypothetical protein
VSTEKARERTVTRSFRITESAFSALQQEAEKRNISINTMHNLLLLSFSEYDRFLEEFDMVKLSRPTFRRILEASSDQAIKDAGKHAGSTLPKGFLLAKKGRVSLEGLIQYFQLMSRYANLFELNVTRDSGSTTLTLVHDLGLKGSEFFGEYARGALKESGVEDDIQIDENSVRVELKKRSQP